MTTEPLDLDALETQCNLGNVLYPEEGLALIAELRATRAELNRIKRTDMSADDVDGMLRNAHATTELMRKRRDHFIARAERAEAAIARVEYWARHHDFVTTDAWEHFRAALRGDDV